jgi:hypothetical protein
MFKSNFELDARRFTISAISMAISVNAFFVQHFNSNFY